MAKHTSPYLCTEAGCSFRPFRTKANLHRHQREVHSQNLSGKAVRKYFCSEPDCKRRSESFARRDNMLEHCRRMHPASFALGSTSQPWLLDPDKSSGPFNSISGSPGNSDDTNQQSSPPRPLRDSVIDELNDPRRRLVQGLQTEIDRLRGEQAAMHTGFEDKIERIIKVIESLENKK